MLTWIMRGVVCVSSSSKVNLKKKKYARSFLRAGSCGMKKGLQVVDLQAFVRKAGVEPAHPYGRTPLKRMRLPIPPFPQGYSLKAAAKVAAAQIFANPVGTFCRTFLGQHFVKKFSTFVATKRRLTSRLFHPPFFPPF
jgi:hypothetical protein